MRCIGGELENVFQQRPVVKAYQLRQILGYSRQYRKSAVARTFRYFAMRNESLANTPS